MLQTKKLLKLLLLGLLDRFSSRKRICVVTSKCGGFIFTRYMIDAISKVHQYDFNGTLVRELNSQVLEHHLALEDKNENELYFNFSNYYIPSTRYKYNVISENIQILEAKY